MAAHAWRLALLAWLLQDEQPDVDMRRVMELALVHDLGEAVTGDIPAFEKTDEDRAREGQALDQLGLRDSTLELIRGGNALEFLGGSL